MTQAILAIWAAALCAVAARRPGWLLPAAVLCAPFEAAALVSAGGAGVSPYFFTLILIAVRCPFVRPHAGGRLGPTPRARSALAWMAVLAGVGVGGAAVLPRVFAGVAVLSPRLDAEAAAPLSFSTSNVAQAAYLLLNAGLLWYAAQTGGNARTVRSVILATRAAGVVVVGLAVYQFVADYAGLPFPQDLLQSNTAYTMQINTRVLDLPRLCSTFTEPAGMAVYLVGFLMFLAAEPGGGPRWWPAGRIGLVVLTIAVLALSTSSTAMIGLAGAGAWAVARFGLWPLVSGRPNWRATAGLAVVAAAVVGTYAASRTLQDVVRETVFDKDQSSSYNERSGFDAFSGRLAVTTWGMGVGLGSNRGSSFGPSLLSTMGIYGAAALAGLLVQLARPPAPSGGTGDGDPVRRWHPPLAAALVGIVGTKMVSSPDLVTPGMWSAMASLVCVHAARSAPAHTAHTAHGAGRADGADARHPTVPRAAAGRLQPQGSL